MSLITKIGAKVGRSLVKQVKPMEKSFTKVATEDRFFKQPKALNEEFAKIST